MNAKSRFRFTDEFDLHLAREVYGHNPYQDSRKWSLIQINMIQITGKSIGIRTLKERIQNLIKKYSIKAESLKGKSGIEITVTEIDDLLQQIIIMISGYQKRVSCSTSVVERNSSYQEGFQARETACSTLLEGDSTKMGTDISQGRLFLNEPLGDDLGCVPIDISEMTDVTNVIEIENNFEAQLIGEHQREVTPSPMEKNQPEKIKKRPLAQANIMAPKRKRYNTNLKQDTVKYLETKNEKQFELRSRELGLQERKQLLEENKFEIDRQERQKRLEIEEKRLEMEERRLKVHMDLFANQQEVIRILLNK